MTSYAYIEGELLPLMMLWPLPEQWLTVMKPCPILFEALVAAMRSGTIIPSGSNMQRQRHRRGRLDNARQRPR